MEWNELPNMITSGISISAARCKKWKFNDADEDEKPFALVYWTNDKKWRVTRSGKALLNHHLNAKTLEKMMILKNTNADKFGIIEQFYNTFVMANFDERMIEFESYLAKNDKIVNLLTREKNEILDILRGLFAKQINNYFYNFVKKIDAENIQKIVQSAADIPTITKMAKMAEADENEC